MPQVPYSPIPQAGQMVGTPKVGVNTPEAAFSGAIGQAIQGLGKQLGHTGDELFQRAVALQDLRNETDAKNGDAELMKKSALMMADFKTKLGNNASPEALEAHIQQLDQLRQDIRGNLPNDATRRMYDSSSLSFMGREVINAAIHAAGQQKNAAKSAVQSELDANNNYIHQNPNDDVALQRGLQTAEKTIRGTIQPIEGFDNKQTDVVVAKAQSKLLSSRITGLAKTDPAGAEEMLKTYRSRLFGDDIDRTENVVRNQTHTVGARIVSDKIMGSSNLEAVEGKPADSLETLLKRGDDAAKEMGSEDPQFVSAVRNRIHADYIARMQSIKDTEYRNADMIDNAMQQFRPQNLDQLKAVNPQMEGLINNMRPDKRGALERRINSYNAALRKQGNDEEFTRLSGMQDSREGREELLNIRDLGKYGLSQPQMNQIMKVQKDLRKNVEGDPRVNRAIGWFRSAKGSDLEALGIFKRADNNKDDYDKFAGAMREAIDTWVDVYKKPPGEKDIVDTIGPSIIRQQVQSRWFGYGTKKSDPEFKQSVPDDIAKKIKSNPDWLALPQTEQSEDNLRRVYNRMVFKSLFEAGIKKDQDRVGK